MRPTVVLLRCLPASTTVTSPRVVSPTDKCPGNFIATPVTALCPRMKIERTGRACHLYLAIVSYLFVHVFSLFVSFFLPSFLSFSVSLTSVGREKTIDEMTKRRDKAIIRSFDNLKRPLSFIFSPPRTHFTLPEGLPFQAAEI